jgi:hypothetical protein
MLGCRTSICIQDQTLRLPKPIYEAVPFFLVGVGILFITLVVKRYEYAPTMFIWLVGIFCILGGILLFAVRIIYRIRSRVEEED